MRCFRASASCRCGLPPPGGRACPKTRGARVDKAAGEVGKDRLWVAPSCSLLHTPLDLDLETKLDPELKSWLAFAKQKLAEVVALARGERAGIAASSRAVQSRRTSKPRNTAAVQRRGAA